MLDFKTKHEEKCILPRNNIMFKKFQTKCWGKLNKFCNLNVPCNSRILYKLPHVTAIFWRPLATDIQNKR